MKFSIQLPTDKVDQGPEFVTAPAIAEMAQAVEKAGFDAAFVTEHPFPTKEWMDSGGHHALDPFVALSVAAAATRRLRLHTNILVLPYRNPFLLAKSVASLDAVSEGRLIVGAAAGYLEGEFAALGVDFNRRNEACDEVLEAMQQAWSGESIRYRGTGYRADGNLMLPTPVQKPHPPIWIGGNSRAAMRRAARFAQGWSPMPANAARSQRNRTAVIDRIDTLETRIRELQDFAAECGRQESLDIDFVPFALAKGQGFDALREEAAQLADIGVTWLSVGVPSPDRAAFCENVAAFGEEVIAQL